MAWDEKWRDLEYGGVQGGSEWWVLVILAWGWGISGRGCVEGEVLGTDPVNLFWWWLGTNQQAVVTKNKQKKYTKRDSQIIFSPQKNKIHSPYETWKLQTGTEEFLIQYSSDYTNIIPYIELKIIIIILFKKILQIYI